MSSASLADPSSLRKIRDEILQALKSSLDDIIKELAKLERSERYRKATFLRSEWIKTIGINAYKNLAYFWDHVSNYSTQDIPDYLCLDILLLGPQSAGMFVFLET
jgi:hypothetical protein